MMRAKVKVPFRDKHTKVMYTKVGQFISLSAERLEELTEKGYVTPAPKKASPKKENQQAAERSTKEEKSTHSTK